MNTIKDGQDTFEMELYRATYQRQQESKKAGTSEKKQEPGLSNRAIEPAEPVTIPKSANDTISRGPRARTPSIGKMLLAGEYGGHPFVFLDAKYPNHRLLDIWRLRSIAARYRSFYVEKLKTGYCIVFDGGLKGQIGAFACYRFFQNRNITGVGTNIKAQLYDSRLRQVVQRELNALRHGEPEAEDSHLIELTPRSNPLSSGLLVQLDKTPEREPDDKLYTNYNDPRGEKRRKQAEEDMDSKLRRLEVTIGHSYRGIMTQVEELLAQASVTRTFGKRKYDAIKSEHRATMEVIQNDVASQQNADLSALWADTAAQNSARVKLEPQQVSFVSRLSKSFQDIVFFFALNTWTSDAVALPDSEKIFMNEKGVFSLCYPDKHPELVEQWPIDPSVEFLLASSIFVASKYVAVRGDLRPMISKFCKIAGLPEPYQVRLESRGAWLIYQTTEDETTNGKTKKLYEKVVTLGTMVPVLYKGVVTTFNFKLVENRGMFSRPSSNFELVSSKVILTDARVSLPEHSASLNPAEPPAKKAKRTTPHEPFEVVDGPIFPFVNGIPYIFIPKIHPDPHLAEPWEVKAVYTKLPAECDRNILWVKGNKYGIFAAFIDYEKAESQDGALLASRQYLSHVVWGKSEFHSRVEGVAFNN